MERLQVYVMANKFTREEMQQMEALITAFFKANGIPLEVPVDVFALATRLGFDVRGAILPNKLEGLLMVDETSEQIGMFSSNKVIAYNMRKSINSVKFIVAHELAHYIEAKQGAEGSGDQIVVAARDHEGSYSSNISEQRKDYIAAAILMPRQDMLDTFPVKAASKADYQQLVARYRVDRKLAERRVEEVYNG